MRSQELCAQDVNSATLTGDSGTTQSLSESPESSPSVVILQLSAFNPNISGTTIHTLLRSSTSFCRISRVHTLHSPKSAAKSRIRSRWKHNTLQRPRTCVRIRSLSDSLTLVHRANVLHWGQGESANTALFRAPRSHVSRGDARCSA